MFQSLGWFFGLNYRGWSTKRLPDAKPRPARVKPVAMLDTVQEISIYIHRFHNLDLFQQGYGLINPPLHANSFCLFIRFFKYTFEMDSSFAHWLLICSDGIKLRLPSDGKTASILLWELRQELFNTKVLYKSMYTHVCVCVFL